MVFILRHLAACGIDTTVNNIMKIAGISRQATIALMEPLIASGAVSKEVTLNVGGRGRAYRFVLLESL